MSLPYIPDEMLERFILDDVPQGDLTSRSLGLGAQPALMEFRAKATMVVSSGEEAARLLRRLGCTAEVVAASGSKVEAGALLLTATGPAEAILAGWKVSQTLMEYASGIASAAGRMVAAARAVNPRVVVACTRKTFPGTKAIAIKAILAGGAAPHRLGLSDTLLLFPEHRALLGEGSLAQAIGRLKEACPEKKVVVEVNGLEDGMAAAEAGADVIQLEKFSPEEVARAVKALSPLGVHVAAAGGVNAANAAAYAEAGAHVLVSSAPYQAPPADVKVTISPLKA